MGLQMLMMYTRDTCREIGGGWKPSIIPVTGSVSNLYNRLNASIQQASKIASEQMLSRTFLRAAILEGQQEAAYLGNSLFLMGSGLGSAK